MDRLSPAGLLGEGPDAIVPNGSTGEGRHQSFLLTNRTLLTAPHKPAWIGVRLGGRTPSARQRRVGRESNGTRPCVSSIGLRDATRRLCSSMAAALREMTATGRQQAIYSQAGCKETATELTLCRPG
jgi:hypothetical protein